MTFKCVGYQQKEARLAGDPTFAPIRASRCLGSAAMVMGYEEITVAATKTVKFTAGKVFKNA